MKKNSYKNIRIEVRKFEIFKGKRPIDMNSILMIYNRSGYQRLSCAKEDHHNDEIQEINSGICIKNCVHHMIMT